MALPPLPAGFDVDREFPIVRQWTFLNHAAVAPISARAAAAVDQYSIEAREHAYLTGNWYGKAETTRNLAAKLLNGAPEEIALVKNTSEGLAFVASGLAWKAGDEIIGTAVEYPANIYPWMDVAKRFNAKFTMIAERNGRIDQQELLAAVTPRTRMIALSHVEYASGFCNDVASIGRYCREHNILFCVDAIQSLGVLPVDVRAMNIDFLAADGHKWLVGPEGAGIFYCRRDLQSSLHPEIGWMNVINATDYGSYDFTLRDDARRFECGSYNIPGVLALGASLRLLLDVGIDLIAARVLGLTQHLADGLVAKGYKVVSSRKTGEASGIVSFVSDKHDHKQLAKQLQDKKIVIALREGRLRASPHFYNSLEHLDKLLNALPGH